MITKVPKTKIPCDDENRPTNIKNCLPPRYYSYKIGNRSNSKFSNV